MTFVRLLLILSVLFKGLTKVPPLCSVLEGNKLEQGRGEQSSFVIQCLNPVWEQEGGQVVVAVNPGEGLSLCLNITGDCHLEQELVNINMTKHTDNFTLIVKAVDVGVRCVRYTSVYMKQGKVFPAELTEEAVVLVHNMTNFFDTEKELFEIPDVYTEVIVLEQEQEQDETEREVETIENEVNELNETEEVGRVAPAEHYLTIINDQKIDLAYRNYINGDLSQWREFDVFTKSSRVSVEAKGNYFSNILVMLSLSAANFMIGTGISWRAVTWLVEVFCSSCRQCSYLSGSFTMKAWKVGLLCQVFYPTLLSFAMAKLVFRSNLQCRSVADISRLGLFLLGTAPGNTSSTYFVALWEGDLQLAVVLVILSTLLSPLTSLFWWNTLGKVLLTNATTDALVVPIQNIIEFISIMVIPIFIGIYMAAKFPTLGKFMEQIRKPIIVIGMTGCIVIYYFQYQHFFSLFTLSHFAACSVLAFGSSLLAGLTAYFCRLSKEQILSIVITCGLQNGTLTYAVINGTLEDPSTLYAMLPANAQILFTSLPIIFLWLLFQGSWRLIDCVQSKGKHCRSINSQTQSVAVVQENPYPMVRIADIKEAWSDQHNIGPLWC